MAGFRRKAAIRKKTIRSEEHTSELQSLRHLVCRLLLEKKKKHRSLDHSSHANVGKRFRPDPYSAALTHLVFVSPWPRDDTDHAYQTLVAVATLMSHSEE